MAVWQFSGFVVIILMVIFSRPELTGLRNLSFDVIAFLLECLAKLGSNTFLLVIEIKNRGTVLRADIRPLAV